MKHLLHYILPVAALLTVACSNIDENERLITIGELPEKEEGTTTDDMLDTLTEPVPRYVLLEDFTGQECPNCPVATKIIGEIEATYNVVPVAIHSKPMGINENDNPQGLGTDLGDSYAKHWNLTSQPQGLIDRVGGMLFPHTNWLQLVGASIGQKRTSLVDIRIDPLYVAEDDSADVAVYVASVKDSAAVAGKLQLWITEDSIIAPQDSMSTKLPNYVHNHVLRAAINGDWGEDVSVGGGDIRTIEHRIKLKSQWKPRHLAVVAFIYNDNGVVQATRKRLIEE